MVRVWIPRWRYARGVLPVLTAVSHAYLVQEGGMKPFDQYYGDQVRTRYRSEIETTCQLQFAALPQAQAVLTASSSGA
jgi:hypothetical protein